MRSVLAACLSAAMVGYPATAADSRQEETQSPVFRVATFNVSLNRGAEGALRRELSTPDSAQARAIAEIIQRVRPDVLLLQEFDYDARGEALASFQTNYLGRPQRGAERIRYPHAFFAESNTGQPSGFDLDNDGMVGGGQDALGFGEFPGQYAMALLSRFPIDVRNVRTFRKFPWRALPGARLPDDPRTPASGDWYSPGELAVLPLSSKSHWDVPVRVGRLTVHVLASHPTPPAFDGPEDRNGLRNHDEIRLWSDYLSGRGAYLRDDQGGRGGFRGRHFVLLGDLNSDPAAGDSHRAPLLSLLTHPRVNSRLTPSSGGATEAAAEQSGANATQPGDPSFDTADFNDRVVGNLRVDYVLPSRTLAICDAGVFWPRRSEPGADLVWGDHTSHHDRRGPSSDHRLVWLDLTADAARCPPGSDPTASESAHPRR